MDASVARAAPKLTNPVAADEASLVAGARIYRDHCTLCHGDPAHPKSPLADSLNPPPPQFMDEMADMPENQNFYILEHGIRWTAMPPPSKFSRKQRHARSRSPAPIPLIGAIVYPRKRSLNFRFVQYRTRPS